MQNIIERKYWLILLAICVFAFATRIHRLGEIKGYIFDEVYHGITSKLIARNDPRAYEWWNQPVEPNTAVDWLHPPLAKYTQALGIKVFGETPFGWRISATVFGVAVIFVIAEFTRYLFHDKRLALLAALLSSFDGLLLTQSRIAMNDIHVTFMLILTFFCFAWYRRTLHKYTTHPEQAYTLRNTVRLSLLLTGLLVGLAMGTKWSGFFAFVVVWFFEVIFFMTQLDKIAPTSREKAKEIFARVLLIGVLPFVVYVLSYSHMFLQGKSLVCEGNQIVQGQCYCNQQSSTWVKAVGAFAGGDQTRWQKLEERGGCKRLISHFSELHNQIFWYQTNLKATHTYQSRPIDWFLNLRPVWFYVAYEQDKSVNIYAQGNPALFWLGNVSVFASLIALSTYAATVLSKPSKAKTAQLYHRARHALVSITNIDRQIGQLFYLTVIYFAVWIPWQASPRIMFFYHYTPAVPLLAAILSYWLLKALKYEHTKHFLVTVVVAVAVTFALFYPNWTGIPVPKAFADFLYFSIQTWK